MNYLIDTNILLWFSQNDSRLTKEYKSQILNINSGIFVSMASLWEISIKFSLQKLKLPVALEIYINDIKLKYDFQILPIKIEHIIKQASLSFHHRDPFDRLIFAQSLVEEVEFLYSDKIFDLYKTGEQA